MIKKTKSFSLRIKNSGSNAQEIALFDCGTLTRPNFNFPNTISLITVYDENNFVFSNYMQVLNYVGNTPLLLKQVQTNHYPAEKFKKETMLSGDDVREVSLPFNTDLYMMFDTDAPRFMGNSRIVFSAPGNSESNLLVTFEEISFSKQELEFIEFGKFIGAFQENEILKSITELSSTQQK